MAVSSDFTLYTYHDLPLVQTKPIPGGRDTPLFRCSIIPPFQADAFRAKRTQFLATPDGTRPEGRGPAGNCAKQSQFCGPAGGPEGEMCEKNPILGELRSARPCLAGRAPVHAKQTQFGPPGGRPWSPGEENVRNERNLDQPGQGADGRKMQNEPNSGRRQPERGQRDVGRGPMCRTKPISPAPGRRGRRIVQNEASLEGLSCETNPISPAGTRPEGRGTRGDGAKQSQFGR
jgi:hypothetical protein